MKRFPIQSVKLILMLFHQKQKAFYGLSSCGLPKLCARLLFAYVCESRVRFSGGEYAAEMFFS
jgi:hypothetical protein